MAEPQFESADVPNREPAYLSIADIETAATVPRHAWRHIAKIPFSALLPLPGVVLPHVLRLGGWSR